MTKTNSKIRFRLWGHFICSRIYQSKTAFFDWSPNRAFSRSQNRAFSTQLCLTENSDWRIQSKNLSQKNFTRVFWPDRIAHPTTKHTRTWPHTHTRYNTAVSYNALTLAWLSQLLRLAASQRGAFLVSLASSVYHTTAAARGLDPMLPTTAAPAVALAALGCVQLHERSFGGFRLSPKPRNRWDEGSSSRCSRRKREAQSCQHISTAAQKYTPSHQPPTGRAQKL